MVQLFRWVKRCEESYFFAIGEVAPGVLGAIPEACEQLPALRGLSFLPFILAKFADRSQDPTGP